MRTALHGLMVVALCLTATAAYAQQSPLETKDKAVIEFDINLEKITQSELGKQLGLAEKMQGIPGIKADEMDPSSVSRLFGALSLPDNIAAFEGMGPGSALPMELFSQVEITDGDTMAEVVKKMEEKSEEVTVAGRKFFKSNEAESPEGMLFHQVDEKTLEMGTEKYVTRADREVMSEGLKKAWSMTPDHAIRIVVDVEGMEALKNEIVEMVGEQQPQAAAYAELLNNINNLRISIDLDADELLTISATGKDEELAEEFADGLDSLLMFAKMGLNPANAPNEDAAAVMQEISGALKANLDGNEVNIKIPHPEGFGKVLEQLMPPGF